MSGQGTGNREQRTACDQAAREARANGSSVPSTPVVVHVARDAYDVYIGRAWLGRGNTLGPKKIEELLASPYANPFRVRREGERNAALDQYEALWRNRLAGKARRLWLGRLEALGGKRLGCWCAPKPCHGDVLVRLWTEFFGNRGNAAKE